MSITVTALTSAQRASLLADPAQLDGMPVLAGAAPPEFLLRAASADLALFAFVSASPPHVVGSAMLKRRPEPGRVEIGYGVAESARGKGVATAAVRQVMARAFADPGVDEVYAETAVDNTASRRVVEKAGFSHVGQRASEEDGRVDQWLLSRATGAGVYLQLGVDETWRIPRIPPPRPFTRCLPRMFTRC
jgi:ribosomal protein S18 acetylase RimI-like enzyme